MIFINRLKHLWNKRLMPDPLETQWYSAKQIRNYQEKRLRKMVRYAYKEIPYYRQLFDKHQIKPQHVKCLEDLKRIPILSRKDAIEHYNQLVNPQVILNTHLSSATTGQRLKWAYSKKWSELFGKTLWRGFSWADLNPHQRVVSFFSRVIGEVVKDCLIIREAFDLNTIEKDLELVKQFKPDFAYCYASSAFLTAQYLLKKGIRIPLKSVIVTSDYLFPHYKPSIEEAFQCKVYNNYGCNDGGAWGAECEERLGFHHDFERSIIEFENGKMIVTDLWNEAMPLIRYQNGDTGEWLNQTCPCRREMPLFTVKGRMSDYIITPTQVFSPTAIDILLRNEYFCHIQFIQHTERELEILYKPNLQFPKDEVQSFLNKFVTHFKDMVITLNQKEHLEETSSHKRRICINHSEQTLESFFARS